MYGVKSFLQYLYFTVNPSGHGPCLTFRNQSGMGLLKVTSRPSAHRKRWVGQAGKGEFAYSLLPPSELYVFVSVLD